MAAKRHTLEEVILRAKERFGDRLCFKDSIYQGNKNPLVVKCIHHGIFTTTPLNLNRSKDGCPTCSIGKLQCDDFIKRANKRFDKKYDYSQVDYVNTSTKVKIVCKDHGSFLMTPYEHYGRGHGCPKCGVDRFRVTPEDYIYRVRKVHGDRYDYSKTKYVHNQKKVTIICREHGPFKQEARVHLDGSGCGKCFQKRNRSSLTKFIENAQKLHGDRYDYSNVEYVNNKTPVIIICRLHGEFKTLPNSHLAIRCGCPKCKESKGEMRIRNFLLSHHIDFIQEYRIAGFKYRYDFYLPKLNLLVEFHGQQHYKPVNIFGGEAGYKNTVKRDKIKRELAKRNNYRMTTMSYRSMHSNNLERIFKAKLINLGQVFAKTK